MSKYIKSIHSLAVAAGTLLTISLSLATPDSSALVLAVPDIRGVWAGFYQVGQDPAEPGRTEITGQENRRFTGIVDWGDPHVIEGTVSASGQVNYQGQSADTHILGKMDLLDYGGDAAILAGTETRISNDVSLADPCALVMRAFDQPADTAIPNARGRYIGTFSGDDGITGQINMLLLGPPDPIRPTSFGGSLEIVVGGQTHTVQLLATANSGGRIIAIGHKSTAGHLILDATLSDPPEPGQPTTLKGGFTMEHGDGSVLEGTFQTQISSDPRTDN